MSRKARPQASPSREQIIPVTESPANSSLMALLLKIWWMAFGNLPIFFIPMLIVKDRITGFSIYDVLFIVSWALLIGTRLIYAKVYEPAPDGALKKYCFVLTAISAGMIAAAHLYMGFVG